MTSPAALQGVLAKLRERFIESSGNTIGSLSQLADQIQVTPNAPELIETLRRELHRVHGTAGSYGFHEASRLAGALELAAIQWSTNPLLDVERRGTIVRQFVRSLETALVPSEGGAIPGLSHRLLLVDLKDSTASALIPEAIHRGYFVERISASSIDSVLEGGVPQAVIASASLQLSVPEGVPLVLVVEDGSSVAAHDLSARVVDASLDPREILSIAESLSSYTRMAGATMLVVDDDPQTLDLFRVLGEREGMFVKTSRTTDGIEALIDEFRPALLLLDIDGVNGIATTRRLRASRRYPDLPIILVSGSTDVETREASFSAGADDFQAKPIVSNELMRRIERLLELHRQRQVSRGLHPATGLWMRERAIRAFDEALIEATASDQPMSLALVRPTESPDGVQRAALWHRECGVLASAIGSEGGLAGFLDESSLVLLAPMDAESLSSRLEMFSEASAGEVSAWKAGVSELREGSEPGASRLARDAEEGWLAARDSDSRVHRWSAADVDRAPDVVVVEDDPALTDLITFALSSRGLTHRAYHNGPEALEGLRTMRVHGRAPIVLLDVDLPGLDGFSLFERIRVDRPGVFRVVFVTVRASEGDQLRALRAGALDYLTKPVSLRVLLAKIAIWRRGLNQS